MKLRASDITIGMALFCAAVLTRLPFRSRMLYHWDAVNFALSLEHYDVRLHQPHPPGYILYSMLGGLLFRVFEDANTSLVWLSVVGGALGVAALYWLGLLMFGRAAGIAAGVLALTSPLVWFYGELALTYAVEFTVVTVLAGLCYLMLRGHSGVWFWLAVLLGIAGGIRQNDLLFFVPLWLVCLLHVSWKQRIASVAVLAAVVALWMWPMLMLSGGPGSYAAALNAESGGIIDQSGIFSLRELALNGGRMALYLGYGVLGGLLLLIWGAIRVVRHARSVVVDRRAWHLALWIVPSLAFYLLIHLRQHGHVFTFLPAVLLLVAVAAVRLGSNISRAHGGVAAGAVVTLLALSNAAFFLFAPAAVMGSNQLPLQTPSRQSIAQRDSYLSERVSAIKAAFAPDDTVVLAGSINFRHPDFYLRAYQETALSHELGDEAVLLPRNVNTLVLFDDTVLPQVGMSNLSKLQLPDGTSLRYVSWSDGQEARVSRTSLELQSPRSSGFTTNSGETR